MRPPLGELSWPRMQIERHNQSGQFGRDELKEKFEADRRFWASPEGRAAKRRQEARAGRRVELPADPEVARFAVIFGKTLKLTLR